MTHHLKCLTIYFEAILNETKTFEVRKNDRDFKVGDILVLQEYQPDAVNEWNTNGVYTDREIRKEVTYILHEFMGMIPANYCIMAIKTPTGN